MAMYAAEAASGAQPCRQRPQRRQVVSVTMPPITLSVSQPQLVCCCSLQPHESVLVPPTVPGQQLPEFSPLTDPQPQQRQQQF